MTYPDDLEKRLGFDLIRERIYQYCLGDLGRAHASGIIFLTDPDSIRALCVKNNEAKLLLERGEDFPIRPYDDPAPWFQVASVEGSYLEPGPLSNIADSVQMIQEASIFLATNPADQPHLAQLALAKGFGKKAVDAVRSKINEEGDLKDNASSGLARIRRRLREEELRARRIADQIMRQVVDQGWCPEGSNPTIRDGRLVIPLSVEHKRRIKGYLVDQSATGQTVFLEPAEVMEANNDLRDLQLEERKEIICILREITDVIRLNLPEIEAGYKLLGLLDFYRAKAKVSRDLHAGLPVILPVPALRWSNARHPILFLTLRNKRPLVPLTISLSEADRFLLVSGPNAGGKSVCLKTVGLIQYMAQCGLLVPMDEDSEVGIFDSIFLDIGDQQSIESDLSTYSSHLKNMDHFIRQGSAGTLILMDELGSGTDPNFGGGIAQAILEQLVERKAWGLATTHYYNLKVFASHFPGIRNASMQFDTAKLVPLYLLEIGQPGSSFALEIARKTGLSSDTLAAATRIMGSELIGLETLMKQVAEEKLRLAEIEKDVSAREARTASVVAKYEALLEKLELQKMEILNKAKAEASTLLQETNREIEKTIRHIQENKADKQETRKVRLGLRELEKKVKIHPAQHPKPMGPLKEGDKVRMIGGEVTGTLLSLKGSKAVVQFGDLRSSIKVDRLVPSDQVSSAVPKRQNHLVRHSEFTSMLDIRGMRVEEVMPLLTRFMDDATQFGLLEVRILHGKGEGVLRKVVREYLKKTGSVASFHDEHADRGGDGITLARLESGN